MPRPVPKKAVTLIEILRHGNGQKDLEKKHLPYCYDCRSRNFQSRDFMHHSGIFILLFSSIIVDAKRSAPCNCSVGSNPSAAAVWRSHCSGARPRRSMKRAKLTGLPGARQRNLVIWILQIIHHQHIIIYIYVTYLRGHTRSGPWCLMKISHSIVPSSWIRDGIWGSYHQQQKTAKPCPQWQCRWKGLRICKRCSVHWVRVTMDCASVATCLDRRICLESRTVFAECARTTLTSLNLHKATIKPLPYQSLDEECLRPLVLAGLSTS